MLIDSRAGGCEAERPGTSCRGAEVGARLFMDW
jgi:hypothetical protein